jgi:hypothetical protein
LPEPRVLGVDQVVAQHKFRTILIQAAFRHDLLSMPILTSHTTRPGRVTAFRTRSLRLALAAGQCEDVRYED